MILKNTTHKETTKKDKILACFGFLTLKSTAKVCNASISWVSNVWRDNGFDYKELTGTYKHPYK